MNKELMRLAGLGDQVDAVEMGKCPFCGDTVNKDDFRDALSFREFSISGLCQKCQDATFGI